MSSNPFGSQGILSETSNSARRQAFEELQEQAQTDISQSQVEREGFRGQFELTLLGPMNIVPYKSDYKLDFTG